MKNKSFVLNMFYMYMFQMGLLIPLSVILGEKSLVLFNLFMLSTLLLYAIYYKKAVSVFIVILFWITFLSVMQILSSVDIEKSVEYGVQVFIKSLVPMFIGLLLPYEKINPKTFLSKGYSYARLNLAFICILFYSKYNFMNYMRLGYAVLPSTMFFIAYFLDAREIKSLVLFFVSFVFQLFYGARGSLLPLIIYIIYKLIRETKIPSIVFIVGIYVVIMWTGNNKDSLLKILDLLMANINAKSYSLIKIKMAIEYGLKESSSGRNLIYMQMINSIKESPLLGKGFGFTYTEYGTAHNFFLQILTEFGLVGALVSTVLFICIFYVYKNINFQRYEKEMLKFIFMIVFGRLLVSSDILLRHEIYFLITYIYSKRRKISEGNFAHR